MSLFKKKEPREIKDTDPLFIKLWYNPRSHAIMVLSAYFVFFAIILIMVAITGKSQNNNLNIKGSSLLNSFNAIDEENILYNFVITIGNKTYYFSGSDLNNSLYGTLLSNGESSTIKIENDQCIVGEYKNDEFIPSYMLCPENINYSFFNIMNIYKLIDSINGTKSNIDKNYVFKDKNNNEIKIYRDNNDIISKIIIKDKNNDLYELNYSEETNNQQETNTVESE